ncbi:MAG: hypothetical protein KDD58_11930 [Bdellovibrionales bacterium]|nr:hypothetical protein [Bdellovibrionales bacterium]
MKYFTWTLLIIFPYISLSRVDVVDWTVLEQDWRKPLCLQEAVYPLDSSRADVLATQKEKQLKSEFGVSKLESLAFGKSAPNPTVLEPMKEIILLKALEVARAKNVKSQQLNVVKKYAKAAYTVCSRILNTHPSTRCHDFLLVNIKPKEFIDLVGNHFEEYKASAIYLLDMQGQCRPLSDPDWNCSELAKDYFAKNHLTSCVAGQLEPPEKLEPMAELTDEAKASW